MGKIIPKKFLFPKKVNVDYIVRQSLPAFETLGDIFQLVVLPFPINIFCLSNPDHIKAVSAHKECGTIKPEITPKADFFMGNGVFNNLGGPEWMARRKELLPAFTEKNSMHYTNCLPYCLDEMKARWIKNGSTKPLDLFKELLRLVLNYSAYALFSKKYSEKELDWIVEATDFAETLFTTLIPYWMPTPNNVKYGQVRKEFHKVFDGIINEHRQNSDFSQTDILKPLLNEVNALTGKPHTNQEIREQMLSLHFGTPAMGLTILWGIFVLSTQPAMLEKVRVELNSVLGDHIPTSDDLEKLPYLEMFVKEIFRLNPAFIGSFRYAQKPIEIDGYSFPANSVFAMIRIVAQTRPEHWDNPLEFRPERHAQRPKCPHALMPFSLGPRMCLGRVLATVVVPLVIAHIVKNFDVRFENEQVDVRYAFGIYPAQKMWAHVTARTAL